MTRGGKQVVINSKYDWPLIPVISVTIATIATTTHGCHGNQESILKCHYYSYKWLLQIVGTNQLRILIDSYVRYCR